MFRVDALKLTLLIGLFMSSCSSDIQEKSSENSSFTAAQVTAVSVLQESTKAPNWNSIIIGSGFTLKVCLHDIAIENQPARNASFEIVTPFRRQKTQTDSTGCLSWDDHIEFNSLEQEGYFPYDIEIIGVSSFNGSVHKKLLLNPWSESPGNLVVDLNWIGSISVSEGDIRQLNQVESTVEKINNFKIKNLSIKMREKRTNTSERTDELVYDLSFNPVITRKGIKGNDIDLKSDNGHIKLFLSLYEKKTDEYKFRLIDKTEKEIIYKDNSVISEMVIKLPGYVKLDSDSVFQARVEVSPLNAPAGLGKERLLTYFNNLFSSNSIIPNRVLVFPEDVSKQDLYRTDSDNIAFNGSADDSSADDETNIPLTEPERPEANDDHFGYMINTVTISKGQIISGNYNNGTLKRLKADIKVCLVDPRSPGKSKPITDARFLTLFETENGSADHDENRIRPVNSNGCLETYAVLTYDKYDTEKFIPLKMKIRGIDGIYKDISKERKLAMNPWAKGSTFGYDINQNGEPPVLEAKSPRINITDVIYSNEGNKYSSFRINDYMNLSFKKNFQVNFKLQVERFHSFSEETSLEPLTMGRYHLRAYIFNPKKNDVDFNHIKMSEFNVISASEKVIEAKANGDVVTNIEFPFSVTDSYLLGYKNLIVFEVTPIDMGRLDSIVVSAPFFGIGKGSNEKTQPIEKFELDDQTTKIAINLINDGEKNLDSHVNLSPFEYFKR